MAQQASDQEKYLRQLQEFQNKIMQGKEAKEQQRLKEKEKIKIQIELEEEQQRERRQQEELELRRAEQLESEQRYNSIKEEIEHKTRLLDKLILSIKKERNQTIEIHEYRLREKEILLEENRNV